MEYAIKDEGTLNGEVYGFLLINGKRQNEPWISVSQVAKRFNVSIKDIEIV